MVMKEIRVLVPPGKGSASDLARAALALVIVAAACVRAEAPRAVPAAMLVASDGSTRALADVVAAAPVTVIEFFSAHCPCESAHEARMRELYEGYRTRGVQFVAVDSEVGATPARDADLARTRGIPYAIYVDPHGALADRVGAEYATYTLVVDARGAVRYRGGIDSDRTHLTADATLLLRDALDDVLEARPVRRPEGTALGCALQTR
jgi:hypothetical protein